MAATAPLDATAIGFLVKAGKPPAGSSTWQFALDVDVNSVKLEPENGAWNGGLDVIFAPSNDKGNIVGSIGRMVPLNLSAAQREQLLKQGLVLNAPLDIDAATVQIRIILRDTKTGAIGSVTIPLER